MSCIHPISIYQQGKPVTVPCGKCSECLRKKRNDWCVRLYYEHKVSVQSYFLTLTYNEYTVPRNGDIMVLCKRDVQLFLKRLRMELTDVKLRYFFVGEYGDNSERPHYHALIFVDKYLNLNDFRELIGKHWQLGFNSLSEVTPQRISYVASYCLYNNVLYYSQLDAYKDYPPFTLMSKGIGKRIINEDFRKSCLSYVFPNLIDFKAPSVFKDGYRYSMPRYLKEIVFTKSELERIKRYSNQTYLHRVMEDYKHELLLRQKMFELYEKEGERRAKIYLRNNTQSTIENIRNEEEAQLVRQYKHKKNRKI